MEKDVITREERGKILLLEVDLDYAETLIGRRVIYLGIPIFKTQPYSPPPGQTDEYQAIRRWYRQNIQVSGGIFIVHRKDLQRSLSKAQPDAVDYLVIQKEEDRAKHEGWSEPGNEAIEILHWILPTHAVNKALVTTDFIFQNIIVTIQKNAAPLVEIRYFVTPRERTLYYSAYGKPTAHRAL
ncbi:MAG: hypothetical protein JW901_00015 [Dehalococcoidia bacterium]|nr:hypothetical protein [Dehalococcoidia bacterium]